jgi:hypothetical protein
MNLFKLFVLAVRRPLETEVLLMTFGPKLTNRSSATGRIFELKGRSIPILLRAAYRRKK